ncbi:uncharacterized protein B0I36DRAFT_358178 [Microdochium trichocladiopsis]|uniref:BTB domain-containing protein n=1 Tax=Microdochium trichocladiopsis TaxID=1682393 RepID=A0A9P8YK66_9PEZI|nr:uncharacterized protein B0I36DRAFT_358178 [Microdochium trichocladiopsis]KAH7040951.1 hypothetical protein B0I36DRAFT_358178 [Microdochium trichocladiopsis]
MTGTQVTISDGSQAQKASKTASKKKSGHNESSPGVSLSIPSVKSGFVSSNSPIRTEQAADANFSALHGSKQSYNSGDMIHVVVGGAEIVASSSAMMLASPVWGAMLADSFKLTERQTGLTIIKLDGDAKAITLLLDIVHYRFAEVPSTTSLSELYQLSLTIAQYKCEPLIHPWARTWLGLLNLNSANFVSEKDSHKALWIAYTLGDEELYKTMLKTLILSLSRNSDGDLSIEASIKLTDMVLPVALLDIICETRMVLLDTLLTGISKAINPDSAIEICRVGKDEDQCEAIVIGSVMKQLRRHKLFPELPKAVDYKGSVQALAATIKSIKSLTFVGQNPVPHQSHDGCKLGLDDMADSVLAELPLVITDEHQEHLYLQGRKSGIITAPQTAEVKPAVQQQVEHEGLISTVHSSPCASERETSPSKPAESVEEASIVRSAVVNDDVVADTNKTSEFPAW